MVLLHIYGPYGLVPTPMRSPLPRLAPLLLAAVLLTALAGPATAQTTFATGITGPIGVTQLADGRILVVENGSNNRVSAFNADGTGKTTFASVLSGACDVLQLDNGTVLVTEYTAGRISAFAANGTVLPVFATGVPLAFFITQLTDGTILVTADNNTVRAYSPTGTRLADFATGLNNPAGIVQLADGRVLVHENTANQTSVFNADGTNKQTFATGTGTAFGLEQLADGRILLANSGNNRVRAFSTAKAVLTDFATGLSGPVAVRQLADGRISVSEQNGSSVRVYPFAVARSGFYNPTSTQGDGRGYRLLGAPIKDYTVTNLAALNLVQGIPAGTNATTHPAQYANAGANLYTVYNGNGTYTRPDADDVVAPGRGFFWQFYDRDVLPANVPASNGTGTSRSYELTNFVLSASGAPFDATVQVAFADNVGAGRDDYQMLANPFAQPLAVSGITVSGGIIQGGDVFQAYNPNGNTYQLLMTGSRLAVWQGVFAELVPTIAGAAVTVTYNYASTDAITATPFYGRGAAAAPAAPSVRFALAGTLADGTTVTDEAAFVRFADDGTVGFDALDAGKLTPPTSAFALVAPVALRDGAPTRLAVDTRPTGAVASVPLALAATAAGQFTLTWDVTLPDGAAATLRDEVTGRTVDLTAATDYAFTVDAAQDWADRFTLVVTPDGAVATEGGAPAAFALSAARPNPASGQTALTLTVDRPQHVRASLVDALGRTVAVLHDGEAVGTLTLAVDAGRLAAGVYVVRVEGADGALVRRLTVTR